MIDPVCGMAVEEGEAAGHSAYAGQMYYFCSARCLHDFKANPSAYVQAMGMPLKTPTGVSLTMAAVPAPTAKPAKDLAKDPDLRHGGGQGNRAQNRARRARLLLLASGCQRTFESPEQELKSMKTRVTIALTGVLALAILRAGAFIALATGATIVTWAPIPHCPGSPGACGCSCW